MNPIGDIIKPKEPINPGWRFRGSIPSLEHQTLYYEHPAMGLLVGSGLAVDADHVDIGPQWHISVSYKGQSRCTPEQAQWALKEFGFDDAALEDNHVPGGICRNFWRPVADRFAGMACECQDKETAMIEDKGSYIWRAVK